MGVQVGEAGAQPSENWQYSRSSRGSTCSRNGISSTSEKPSSSFGALNCFLGAEGSEGRGGPAGPHAHPGGAYLWQSLPVAIHDHVRHGGVRRACHLPELRAEGRLVRPCKSREGEGWGRTTHPVVVTRLVQGGAEEEAATGHTCILGALDVPMGTSKSPG